MLKKIMFSGILLFLISAISAKNLTPVNNFFHAGLFYHADEGLLNKIIADNDFKKYYLSNVEFANKVIKTKSGQLFQKYIQKTITQNEQLILLNKLNLKNKKELGDIAVNLKKLHWLLKISSRN